MMTHSMNRLQGIASATMVVAFATFATADQAGDILEAAGFNGGLIVHIGCGDGTLTAALRKSDNTLVHGLDTDAASIAKAREHIRSRGLYGPVSVNVLRGPQLPYADNLANLVVVASGKWQVASEEIMRVLAPRGVLMRTGPQSAIRNPQSIKPVPDGVDDWTHHLHSAAGNPVASDRVAGPPRHLQWTAGPLWSRSHGWTPSVSAMVSAGGRVFYICDEALTCVDGSVPDKWFLSARDAFSGVLLWKHPVPDWGSVHHSGTSGKGAVPRFTMPPNLGKRLVATVDTVYVTLGASAPVTAFDATTGTVRNVFADTARADEILLSGGKLFAAINPDTGQRPAPPGKGQTPPPSPGKHICAVDAETGNTLWRKGPFTAVRATRAQDPHGRLEMVAGDGAVFALTGESIVAINADTGDERWRSDRPAFPEEAVTKVGFGGVYEFLLTAMIYHDGVVLLAQPEPNTHHTYHTMPGTLFAFSAKDGKELWRHAYGGWGHCTQPDLFAVGDTVWTHVNTPAEFASSGGGGIRAKNPAATEYRIQGLDLRTGSLRKEFDTKTIFNVGHHHRCYRNRITERFLLASRRGVEFVDLSTGENWQNHWVRSGCLIGNMPCNGMVYVTPHPCSCYLAAKLIGFNALAPSRETGAGSKETGAADRNRLIRGPAFGSLATRHSPLATAADWPTYRHDGRRSGATEMAVSTELTELWRADIGTRPSAPVIADGKVFVAGVDAHTVVALGMDDGREAWHHVTGARVDSPPTVGNGQAIFGSADGSVTCLRASDGEIAWEFEAAPSQCLVTAFGQLESAWPVHGSVLMQDGKCWFAAGRSSYLDGGIRVYAIDPATGSVAHEQTIYSPDPKTDKMAPQPSAQNLAGFLNDVPSTDGTNVFIRQMRVSPGDSATRPHLYTSGGFMDSSWFNRTYWRFGRAQTSGLMVLGKDVAYGAEVYASRSRETVFKPGSKAYRIKCLSLKAPPKPKEPKPPKGKKRRPSGPKAVWEQRVAIRIEAMVRAGNVIFVAGSPDIVDPDDPHGAWEGRKGGVLAALAASDGKLLAEHKLPAPPSWDGMAAAHGRLFVSLRDGTVVCLGAPR